MATRNTLEAENRGILSAIWSASCAIIDINACEAAEAPLDIYPYDLKGKTPAAVLRATGWVNTKQHGWLCGPCHRAYRTGTLTPSDDYDD